MTHTPGPWSIGNHGSVVTNTPDKQVEITGINAEDTINWYGGHVICETVTNGNAALISAAPELLAALKWCKDALEENGFTISKYALDAIAKAEAQP